MISARRLSGTVRHDRAVCTAAATAASTSARLARSTRPCTSPVAGLNTFALRPDVAEAWLDPTTENVGDILDAAIDAAPDVAETLDDHVVSSAVGNVRNDSPELIERVE